MPHPQAGRYELLQPLGHGGMAELFLARVAGDPRGQVFVLKRILPQHAHDRRFVQMFQRELAIASGIYHANLVPVLDHGQVDGHCFLVMEYVYGLDLAALLERAGEREVEVPIDVAISIVLQAADGLHHLHEQPGREGGAPQLVHRDVSPSNVLVGYDGTVKVTDFGIATASAYTRTTDAGTLKGKAGYMSPEQCRGDALDRRSDVYALGILLFEATVGERLFVADNDYALMLQIVEGRVPRPSTRRSGYPPGLESIVMRALQVEPDQRYATAEAFANALRRFAQASALQTGRERVERWLPSVVERKPYPVFPATPEPVAAPTGAVAMVVPPRRRAVGWLAPAGIALAGLGVVAGLVARSSSSPEPAPTIVTTPATPVEAPPPAPAPPVETTPEAPAVPEVAPPPVPEHEPVPEEITIVDDPPEDEPAKEPKSRRRNKRKRRPEAPQYDLDAPRPPR